ncbi:MAG: NYN domain-containing protein [Acidimicrobiales bacterium]
MTDPDAAGQVPRVLHRVAGFVKLPAAALATVRHALDNDENFRTRVAEAVDDDIDRASYLFLHRPDGWLAEVEGMSVEEPDDSTDGAAVPARRLRAAEKARDRAEEQRAEAEERAARLGREIEDERQRRLDAEQQQAEMAGRVDELTNEVARLSALLREAEGKRAEADHRFAQGAEVRAKLKAELDQVSNRLEQASALSAPVPPADRAPRQDTSRPIDDREARRRPTMLPPAVLDDSVEAARHLAGVAGMVLYVDGYNASIGAWPEVAIEEQRARLISALVELHSRTGVRVRVVFDGTEQTRRTSPASGRGVSVIFTEDGCEADDVIIDAVRDIDRPVTVASDDRRVRDGAGEAGANLLGMRQLFALLGRER